MAENFDIRTYTSQKLTSDMAISDFNKLIEEQGYHTAPGVHVANIVQEAIQEIVKVPNIQRANPASIQKAVYNTVVMGLYPSQKQVYFILYGNELQAQVSYFGSQQLLKRLPEIKDITATVVHADDEFEFEYGDFGPVVTKHVPAKSKNMMSALEQETIGVYATIIMTDGTKRSEIMTMDQIKNSWSQAKTHNVQNKFPEEMMKRTVIQRAAKNIINTSQADDALVQSINETTESEFKNKRKDITEKVSTENSFAELMDATVDESVVNYDEETGEVLEEPEQTEIGIEDMYGTDIK